MAETMEIVRKKGSLGRIMRGLRPAAPATVGAFALTFLFAAMMPMPWIASLCWNLYLDIVHPVFAPPLGNAARVGVALGFALIAALIALVAALALVKPAVKGNREMNRRVAARARQAQSAAEPPEQDSQALRRRRVDGHPDAPAVAPISAGRDLPAGGLGPVNPDTGASLARVNYGLAGGGDDIAMPLDLDTAILLDDAEPALELGAGQVWTETPQPAAAWHDPGDTSLGAMVARFEDGLNQRRTRPAAPTPTALQGDAPPAANEDDGPAVDLALEAALSTLQRMSRSAIG